MKSFYQRAYGAFDSKDHEDICKYLDWLRLQLSEYSQGVRRSIVVTLLLMAIFELIIESPKSQVSIASFRVTRSSIVLVFIPAIVSFMYFQVLVDSTRLIALQQAFVGLFNAWSPRASSNDLDIWIQPPQALFWNVGWAAATYESRTIHAFEAVEAWAARILIVLVLLGGLAFEIQAYYVLYQAPVTHHVLWLISAVCAFFGCVITLVHFLTPTPG